MQLQALNEQILDTLQETEFVRENYCISRFSSLTLIIC